MELKGLRITAACQDPGGSNAVRPVLRALAAEGAEVRVFASERAAPFLAEGRKAFTVIPEGRFGEIPRLLRESRPGVVLLGTSVGKSLEHAFVSAAKAAGIPSVGVLDSWVAYAGRFSDFFSGERFPYLPDRICVMDETARAEMIDEGFPEGRIAVTGNPYFDDLVRRISLRRTPGGKSSATSSRFAGTKVVAFLSQPLDETFGPDASHPGYLGYTQFDALEMLLAALRQASEPWRERVMVAIRPHPKESGQAYSPFLKTRGKVRVRLERRDNLYAFMERADLVCGMFSTALAEAYMLGKPVITLEPGARGKRSPFVLARRAMVPVFSETGKLSEFLTGFLSGNIPQGSGKALLPSGKATQAVVNVVRELAAVQCPVEGQG